MSSINHQQDSSSVPSSSEKKSASKDLAEVLTQSYPTKVFDPVEIRDETEFTLEQVMKDFSIIAKERNYLVEDFQVVEVVKDKEWKVLRVWMIVSVSWSNVFILEFNRAYKYRKTSSQLTQMSEIRGTICDEDYADEIVYKWNSIKYLMDGWAAVLREYKDWKLL